MSPHSYCSISSENIHLGLSLHIRLQRKCHSSIGSICTHSSIHHIAYYYPAFISSLFQIGNLPPWTSFLATRLNIKTPRLPSPRLSSHHQRTQSIYSSNHSTTFPSVTLNPIHYLQNMSPITVAKNSAVVKGEPSLFYRHFVSRC